MIFKCKHQTESLSGRHHVHASIINTDLASVHFFQALPIISLCFSKLKQQQSRIQLKKWNIKSSDAWNLTGDPCIGRAVDSTPITDTSMNPAFKRDCTFNNETTCHVIQISWPAPQRFFVDFPSTGIWASTWWPSAAMTTRKTVATAPWHASFGAIFLYTACIYSPFGVSAICYQPISTGFVPSMMGFADRFEVDCLLLGFSWCFSWDYLADLCSLYDVFCII